MNIIKKILVCVLVASMVLSLGSALAQDEASVATEPTTVTTGESTDTDSNTSDTDADENKVYSTEAEALSDMKKVAETDTLELWLNETEVHFAIKVKSTGYIWWSEPYDADLDASIKAKQLNEAKSSLVIKELETRKEDGSESISENTKNTYTESVSKNKRGDKIIVDEIDNGVKITYKMSTLGVEIPVEYKLVDDHFVATVLGDKIKESKKESKSEESTTYQLLSINLLPNFGAADASDKGYMVIPDGSGAVINYNNGKSTYAEYSAPVYGRDITGILNIKETEREQVYMPVIGLVNNGNALMEVCTSGAERANINAYVGGQKSTNYNGAYFSFTLRTKDTYYIAGDLQQPLDMYESVNTAFTDYSVSYYPLEEKEATYNEIAKRYRKYLAEDEGIEKKAKENDDTVYLTFLGGTYKQTSILGIPANIKTAATTFEQAETMLKELKDEGVKDIVVNYIDWNDDAISRKICTKSNPSGTLGGQSDFDKLQKYADENGIKIYYDMEISEFAKGGNGYNTLFNATACLTKSYSRQTEYDISWGIEAENAQKWSLLSPNAFSSVFDKISSSFTGKGIKNVSLGSVSSALYTDFAKDGTTRYEMADIISDGYKKLSSEVGSTLASKANQYIWANVDHITNLPLYSSGYDIFDYDIPFVELCIHGLIPYSVEPINASANSDELFILAAATASNLSYDFLYEENLKLQNTSYNKYFYANFNGWSKTVGGQHQMLTKIISGLSNETIDKYEYVDTNTIRSTFSNGTVIEVNKKTNTIKVNGEELKYADYGL